jgi:IS4 transposase
VTRAKRNMNARRVYSSATDRSTGVICDQRIALNGRHVARDYPEHLRRVRYRDPETGKNLVFLTNNMTLPPLTIAALYKNRWDVELFFKWIKQHLRSFNSMSRSTHCYRSCRYRFSRKPLFLRPFASMPSLPTCHTPLTN